MIQQMILFRKEIGRQDDGQIPDRNTEVVPYISRGQSIEVKQILACPQEKVTATTRWTDGPRGLTRQQVAQHGGECWACGQHGHWKADCGKRARLRTYISERHQYPDGMELWKLKQNSQYETGWNGEEIVHKMLTDIFKKENVLWLSKHFEYGIPIDLLDQDDGTFIEVKATNQYR